MQARSISDTQCRSLVRCRQINERAVWANLEIKAAGLFKAFHRGYATWLVILGVISIILGIILLFSPMLSAMTIVWLVSTMLMVFGIMHVIQAF